VITHSSEPSRPSTATVPWFGLVCIALAIFCGWSVVQISPQRSLFVSGLATKLSQWGLADSLQFLEGHTLVVVVSVALALMMWALFRRPASR
jgi:hypothetical protein